MVHAGADDVCEAVHLASRLIAATGYLLPIDDHVMAVRNDGHTIAYYRFQTPCLYPSTMPRS